MTITLMGCRMCSAMISPLAQACPKCGYRKTVSATKTSPCRVCGVLLPKGDHRYYEHYTGNSFSISGNSITRSGGSFLAHKPCTSCGEPRPLLRGYYSLYDKFMIFTPIVLAGLMLSKFTPFLNTRESSPITGQSLYMTPGYFILDGILLVFFYALAFAAIWPVTKLIKTLFERFD